MGRFTINLPSLSDSSLGETRVHASEKEGKYEWMAAADIYQRALDKLESTEPAFEIAQIMEGAAKSYFKGAFQAENREEFKRRIQLAHSSHEKAQVLFEKAGLLGLSKTSTARGLFSTFWLADDPRKKKEVVGRCIELADEAAQKFSREGDRRDLAETHRDLLTYIAEAMNLINESGPLKDLLERGVRTGEAAVSEFEALGENEGLLDSVYTTLELLGPIQFGLESSRSQGLVVESGSLIKKLTEASEKAETPYALCLSNEAAAWTALKLEGNQSSALKLFETAKSMAERTGDSLLIGRVLSEIVYTSFWPDVRGENEEDWREALEKGVEYASTAIRHLEIPSHGGWLEYVHWSCAECYISLAIFVETEQEKKKEYLRKAVEISRKGIIYENHTWLTTISHVLSKAMYYLATMESDRQEKIQLLRAALPIREEAVRIQQRFDPQSWNVGAAHNYMALVKAELSVLEHSPTRKSELLQGAVLDMQKCVNLCRRWSTNSAEMRALASYEESYGDILLELYQLTNHADAVQRALKAYNEATALHTGIGHPGPLAPLRWKAAEIYDGIGNFKEASNAFMKAAEDYRLAAVRIPGSASTFGELSTYMEAWSIIEEARVHHNEEQFLLAAENYNRVSSLLKNTRAWSHLSKHYVACSFLEGGEALSRQERHDASVESFTAAANAFHESRDELEGLPNESLIVHGKEEMKNWVWITEGRQRYCQGRIDLEEAKILDKRGEEEASGRKYLSASQVFRVLLTGARSEQDRNEFETLVLFCDGWAKMKEAETKGTPELYSEAADCFAKIEKVPTRRRTRLLALANARMCNALESGTRFRRTRNLQLYSDIKNQLDTAADYYEEAGFKNAADWTRATQRLFDALAYKATAEVELEPKKKTELYHLAEKHLDLAAKLYGDAGFPGKGDEVRRHLKRAREEKELLLTPLEALAENPAISRASTIAPSLTDDQAVGLERFGTANVVGNLSLPERELSVGADLTIELELANIGKTAATLVKLENIVPEGLELDREKVSFRVEDNYIDMKGKRLEYLKTHEVKIPMRALTKGSFELRPRILFVDDKGNYKSYEFEPTTVTVRELGISGWLKGPK